MREARLVQEIVIEDVDRVGVVADISRLLGRHGHQPLRRVRPIVDGESVRIHLITSSQSYARDALRDAGYPFGSGTSSRWSCLITPASCVASPKRSHVAS